MAITVARASSQYAEAASTPLPSSSNTVFTLAAWYKPSSISNGTVLGCGSTSGSEYIALGMDGSGKVFIEVPAGDGLSTGTLTSGAWSHIAGVQASATSRTGYLDGVAGTAHTSSYTPGPFNTTTIGGLMLSGSRLSFAGGDIAECAIWNVALTAAEVASLAAGFVPLLIRPASLVFYAECKGNSPERELIARRELTYGAAGAAPTIASHPRVFRPRSVMVASVPAVGTSATVTAVAAMATGAAPAPAVAAGSVIIAAPALALGDAPAPVISTAQSVAALPAVALGSAPVPALSAGVNVIAPAALALGAAPAPVVVSAAIITLPAALALGSAPAAVLHASSTVTAPAALAAGDAPAPVLTSSAVVVAPAALALGSVPLPVLHAGVLISVPAAVALGLVPPPVASAPAIVYAIVSPWFTPGTVVDVVALTSANERAWAHERVVQPISQPYKLVIPIRPGQVPLLSAVAGDDGVARFLVVPPGRYWIIGEVDGVVRRVACTV